MSRWIELPTTVERLAERVAELNSTLGECAVTLDVIRGRGDSDDLATLAADSYVRHEERGAALLTQARSLAVGFAVGVAGIYAALAAPGIDKGLADAAGFALGMTTLLVSAALLWVLHELMITVVERNVSHMVLERVGATRRMAMLGTRLSRLRRDGAIFLVVAVLALVLGLLAWFKGPDDLPWDGAAVVLWVLSSLCFLFSLPHLWSAGIEARRWRQIELELR